jgi:hypothetical protein
VSTGCSPGLGPLTNRKATLHILGVRDGIELNDQIEHEDRRACVSARLPARLRGTRGEAQGLTLPFWWSLDWIKPKNPMAPAVKREAEEDWKK